MATFAPEAMVRGNREVIDVAFQAGGQDSSVPQPEVAVTTEHLPTPTDVRDSPESSPPTLTTTILTPLQSPRIQDEPAIQTPHESTPGPAGLTLQEDKDVHFITTSGQAVREPPLQPSSVVAQAGTSGAEQGAASPREPGNWSTAHLVNLDDFGHSLDTSTFNNVDFETYIAIPYERTTKSERRDDQTPHKSASANRPFILRRSTQAQRRAALSQPSETNGFADRYDYLKKYPEDPPEEAMGPNARVWRVYLDEAEQFDIDMVDGFKDTVDVMLVFAGLFSAVVTTFLVQASTALQLDYNQVIASVLLEQLQVQRAMSSGLPTPDPLSKTLNLDSTTTTGFDRWANGLWFVSLSCSLATALFAVLVKQWIQSYVSPVSGDPQTRVRVRQYRFIGLEKWHVPLIVGLLPALLHLSLLLFFMGLVVFLFALDHAIAAVTASITTVIYLTYAGANLAPLFDSQCPYKTPLSTYVFLVLHPYIPRIRALSQSIVYLVQITSHPIRLIIRSASRAREPLQALMRPLRRKARQIKRSLITHLEEVYGRYSRHPHRPSSESIDFTQSESIDLSHTSDTPPSHHRRTPGSMKACELEDITAQVDVADATALCWVVTWSSNPSVRTVVVEAAANLRIGYDEQAKGILRAAGVADAACALLQMCTKWQGDHLEVQSGFEQSYLRAALAHIQLGLYMPSTAEVHGPYATMNRFCRCIVSTQFASDHAVDGCLGSYVSLLQYPSRELVRPQHILQSLLPNSPKIIILVSLRRAALQLRNGFSRSKVDMVDWPSCQKLCALVQLEPPPADLFGLWQTTLVSVYLASLVPDVTPISEDSGLIFKLLSKQIELGSSELSQKLAIKLSVESCIQFLAHILKDPTVATNFSSSDGGSRLIKNLRSHSTHRYPQASDPDKDIVSLYHPLLVALLDHGEKNDASTSAELHTFLHKVGSKWCHALSLRDERQSLGPEIDLVPVLRRLLKATLILPQLSVPSKLLAFQIRCLAMVLSYSPPDNLSVLLDVFRQDDGISTLEKIIQSAGSQLDWDARSAFESSLALYLMRILINLVEENSLPSPDTANTPPGGQAAGVDKSNHLSYIVQHLVQIIRICVACHRGKISHSKTDSYPYTLRTLRSLVRTRHEMLPQWNRALAELESQDHTLSVSKLAPGQCHAEHNLQEIIFILRSDLEAARSSGVRYPSRHELRMPLPSRFFISVSEAAKTDGGPTLKATVGEESDYPTTRNQSVVLRSTRRLRTAVWVQGVIAARRVAAEAIIPLLDRTPREHVQEHGPPHSAEEESLMPRRDEEEGLGADTSSTRPT